jgi:O-acetyl-ADP-ribose deacetylase (regulator of RNase III)
VEESCHLPQTGAGRHSMGSARTLCLFQTARQAEVQAKGGPPVPRRFWGLPTGRVVATTAGALRATWIIHTVGPVYADSSDPAGELACCYAASLSVADAIGAKLVAFPAISTGVYGYPLYEAARVAVRAVRSTETRVERVRFVLFGAKAYSVFLDALRAPERENAVTDPERATG